MSLASDIAFERANFLSGLSTSCIDESCRNGLTSGAWLERAIDLSQQSEDSLLEHIRLADLVVYDDFTGERVK